MRHLVAIARAARLEALHTDVLAENASMLRVFEESGLEFATKSEQGTRHVTLRLHYPVGAAAEPGGIRSPLRNTKVRQN